MYCPQNVSARLDMLITWRKLTVIARSCLPISSQCSMESPNGTA
jgi:hypothetical protein